MLRCVLFLCGLVALAHGIALRPEDFPKLNQPGQCPSGLPSDGLFQTCGLSSWHEGIQDFGQAPNPVSFISDFDTIPPFLSFGNVLPDNSGSCSARLSSGGVLYQHMPNILYAHYRLIACARVHGELPCRVEVRTLRNEVVDHIEFQPAANISCSSKVRCIDPSVTTLSGWKNITIRYEGVPLNTITVIDPAVLKPDFSNLATDGIQFEVRSGDDFTLMSSDFSTDFLPSSLAFFTGSKNDRIDVLSLPNDRPSVLPGQRFGDEHQFKLVSAWTDSAEICPINEGSDWLPCPCTDDHAEVQCRMSLKGFIAEPGTEYYIGMSSGYCPCSFDNVCLEEVDSHEGYLGVPWITVGEANSTSSF